MPASRPKPRRPNDLTGFDQNTSNAINPDEWTAAIPLTSKWKDTPTILRSINAVNCQSFCISSSCAPEKVERLMKWVDWLYDYDNYLMAHWGPSAEETEWHLGLKSGYKATKNEETGCIRVHRGRSRGRHLHLLGRLPQPAHSGHHRRLSGPEF
jgi:hypothetical protein